VPRAREDEEQLTADIIELARQYGRYGYRKIVGMLRDLAGWVVNDKRVERVWSYDFVEDQTHEGRKHLMLNVIVEFTHECLAIGIDRPKNSGLDRKANSRLSWIKFECKSTATALHDQSA
jgi:putative transposase